MEEFVSDLAEEQKAREFEEFVTKIRGSLTTHQMRPTRMTADIVAEWLVKFPGVLGVELFGSVARDGVGSDLDLILIVDDETSQGFFQDTRYALEELLPRLRHTRRWRGQSEYHMLDTYLRSKQLRITAAESALGLPYEFCMLGFDLYHEVDIFLFPKDWRDRLEELQCELPHDDHHFMQNVAKDAIPLVGVTKKDPPKDFGDASCDGESGGRG